MQALGHDFVQQRAIAATADAAPSTTVKDVINQIVSEARSINIPWLKIMQAIATAAAGGFSPASIAAAIAILFGTNVPPSLKAHATAP